MRDFSHLLLIQRYSNDTPFSKQPIASNLIIPSTSTTAKMQFATIVASLMAAVAVSAQGAYTNTTTPLTPATNGTSTNGTASPSGTVGSSPSASFEAINAGSRVGASAVMGLVLVGGIAVAL
ncbi:hypothetical protein AC579_7698 [Pseudocercospora musae]|uniref:Uncharacterized protein n=1 Tax=Pseudocercospora musae TaxID=113226 RepID=A0A139IU89_9PEZI|nr:hypothetical protein AC579_7698 [Pseudocercospora musae]KXT18200.1 hypothetical protein AC579_7698 [Pseudocercospora musae]